MDIYEWLQGFWWNILDRCKWRRLIDWLYQTFETEKFNLQKNIDNIEEESDKIDKIDMIDEKIVRWKRSDKRKK